MLATTFSRGQAASSAASMVCEPVVSTPSLSCRCAASSCGLQTTSSWLDSTSKCCSSLRTTSGGMARAIRMRGLLAMSVSFLVLAGGGSSAEPDEAHQYEQRHQNAQRPSHVAEEAGHLHAALLRNGLDHQIWRGADIGVGTHEHRARGDGRQRGGRSEEHTSELQS